MKRLGQVASLVFATCFLLGTVGCSDGGADGGGGDRPSAAATGSPTSPKGSPSIVDSRADDFTFAVIGDFGARTEPQRDIAARMCAWRRTHPFDIVITTGDNIYPDGSPEYFEEAFFEPYECLLQNGVRWHASLGNHDIMTDGGEAQLDEPAFGMKGENYVVRASGVRFVIANSNELDREWLEENLDAERGDRWTVVAFHHPVFSPGFHGSTETFEDLPEMFAEAGVDLVVNGHDHLYSAMEPQQGVRYVVTGGGGANTYPCTLIEQSEICEPVHHFLYVGADAADITVQAVPDRGEPFHEFTTPGVD